MTLQQNNTHITILNSGKVGTSFKHDNCPHCDKPYARREVKLMENGAVVHKACSYDYEQRERKRINLIKQQELQERHESIKTLRGDDPREWARKVYDNSVGFPDGERELAWKIERLLRVGKEYEDLKAKFLETLVGDPIYAMGQSEDLFQKAAELRVADDILDLWGRGLTNEEIMDEARRRALQEMRSPTRSTSVTRSLADQCVGSAWAHVAMPY